MLRRVQQAYAQWADRVYATLPPQLAEEGRRFDRAFYSWRGVAWVCGLVGLAAILAYGLTEWRGKPFGPVFVAMLLFVLSLSFVGLGGWFGFPKIRQKLGRVVVIMTTGAVVGGYFGYLIAPLFAGQLTRDNLIEAVVRTTPVTLALGVFAAAATALIVALRSREHAARARAYELELTQERSARVIAEAELRTLQAQIEPHFLFNTLSAAQYLAGSGDPRAAQLLAELNAFLHCALNTIRKPTVALTEEVERVRHYLAIGSMRLGARLQWSVQVEPEAASTQLPPAVVLTLVENALQHGIEPAVGGGRIDLHAYRSEGVTLIDVRNSGETLKLAPTQGVGLENVRQRLQLLYGDQAGLDLRIDGDQTLARLRVPASA